MCRGLNHVMVVDHCRDLSDQSPEGVTEGACNVQSQGESVTAQFLSLPKLESYTCQLHTLSNLCSRVHQHQHHRQQQQQTPPPNSTGWRQRKPEYCAIPPSWY